MRTRIWKQGVCFFVFFYYQILVVAALLFQIEMPKTMNDLSEVESKKTMKRSAEDEHSATETNFNQGISRRWLVKPNLKKKEGKSYVLRII
ncbi:hypothetical protein MHH33_04545 [Paenisporosarcina sp. FSL H8-0542]|uniref:hypothetical protein n=1 Tax=Paenisporosarcina sp. FSL H8-0542 TaxID=2921401 RepID=UPI00315B219E